jgi:hypothetical protein
MREHTALLGGIELQERLGGEADLRPPERDRALQPLGGGEADRADVTDIPAESLHAGADQRVHHRRSVAEGGEQPCPEHRQPEQESAGHDGPAEEGQPRGRQARDGEGVRLGKRRTLARGHGESGDGRNRRHGRNGGNRGHHAGVCLGRRVDAQRRRGR